MGGGHHHRKGTTMAAEEDPSKTIVNPLDITWNAIGPSVDDILIRLENGLTYQKYTELYGLVYKHCITAVTIKDGARGAVLGGGDLYYKLKAHIQEYLIYLVASHAHLKPAARLTWYAGEWKRFSQSARVIRNIFLYLDRHWVAREATMSSDEKAPSAQDIHTMCLDLWQSIVLTPIEDIIVNQIIVLINEERNGEIVNPSITKNAIESFIFISSINKKLLPINQIIPQKAENLLEFYQSHIEKPYVFAMDKYNATESATFLSAHTLVEYLYYVDSRICKEESLAQHNLHASTLPHIQSHCYDILIARQILLFESDFINLVRNERRSELSLFYRLMKLVTNSMTNCRMFFEKYIFESGQEALNKIDIPIDESLDPTKFVSAIIELYTRFTSLISDCFQGDAYFLAAMDKAFREFVNRNALQDIQSRSGSGLVLRPPEILGKYSDLVLKKGSGPSRIGSVSNGIAIGNEELNIEACLNNIMTVFKYIEDKDIFQKVYSRMLAKRLVNELSVSEDLEASMIARLKESCGYDYTSKIQRMFTDIDLSRNLNERFKNSGSLGMPGIEFNTLVCGSGQWPLNAPSSDFSLPIALTQYATAFSAFYTKQHSGRKLTYCPHISKAETKATFGPMTYTFQVSTYQLAILMLFNERSTLSFDEIQAATLLPPPLLTSILAIFLKAKLFLLQANENNPGSSIYSLNTDFKSRKIKINLNVPIKSEQAAEAEDTRKTVEEDRNILIQAAIVRIMKARKTLKHVQLVNEVIDQVSNRFKPTIGEIKKAIDVMIDKEYLERASSQPDHLNYLA